MTTFDERERAYEKKFQLDEEMKFKIDCLAAKFLGRWAGEQMELEEGEAMAYIDQALDAAIKMSAHGLLLVKVEKDMQAKGIPVSRPKLERELAEFQTIARKKLLESV